jgi:excisionase family DNA binding protein
VLNRQPSRTPAPERLALSIAETAIALGLSRPSVYRMIERGELKSVQAGARQLITAASLSDFLSGDQRGGDAR